MFKNKSCENLTIEKLKTFKGLKNLTDKEAEIIIASLEIYTTLVYEQLIKHINTNTYGSV